MRRLAPAAAAAAITALLLAGCTMGGSSDSGEPAVDVPSGEVAPDPRPDDFWSGIVAGWNALIAFANWLGIAVGVMLPWLGVALVAGAIIVAIVVLATRGRKHGPEAATSPPDASRSDTPEA